MKIHVTMEKKKEKPFFQIKLFVEMVTTLRNSDLQIINLQFHITIQETHEQTCKTYAMVYTLPNYSAENSENFTEHRCPPSLHQNDITERVILSWVVRSTSSLSLSKSSSAKSLNSVSSWHRATKLFINFQKIQQIG